MRRHTLLTAAAACALLTLPIAAHAAPAPPGDATATAVQVGELVGVSETGAHSGDETTRSEAAVVEVGDEPLLELGGSQDGEGADSDALLDTGPEAPVNAQVAPWKTTVTSSQNGESETRTAHASSALTRAEVEDVVRADVVESSSEATYRDQERSTGSAVSNGADLAIADAIHLVLLHSEVNSKGEGSSHLVGLNGTEIGTDEQLGEICALPANPVVSLSCLAAAGGFGDTGEVAGEADAVHATSETVEAINPARAFAVSTSSGTATGTTLPDLTTPVTAGDTEATRDQTQDPRPFTAAEAAPAGTLPRTGAGLASLLWVALGGIGSGGALWFAARGRHHGA